MNLLRHRHLFLIGGAILAAVASFLTDPDTHGLSTFLGGLALIQGVWAVAFAHWGRKALTDYPEADQRRLFAKAAEDPVGAGPSTSGPCHDPPCRHDYRLNSRKAEIVVLS